MYSRRLEKVNALLKAAISETILKDCTHYNFPEFITVTKVITTKDLRGAKVYVSMISQDSEEKEEAVKLLQKFAKPIAFATAKKVVLRYFPSLTFYLDDTVDAYMEIDTLLKKIHKSTDDASGNSTC